MQFRMESRERAASAARFTLPGLQRKRDSSGEHGGLLFPIGPGLSMSVHS